MIETLRAKVTDAPIDRGLATFLNPHSYLLMRPHAELLERFDAVYLDGSSMVLAVRFGLRRRVARRSLDMTSLAPSLLGRASREGRTLAVIGGRPGVAESAVSAWETAVGPLTVTRCEHGYFASEKERRLAVERIAAGHPDIVLVGMGSPLQERVLVELEDAGWTGLGLTCGGFLHQSASAEGGRYYPRFFDVMNLRWLYRMYDEPRLIPRYLVRYPRFVFVFVRDVLRGRA